jgi:hypothetical protein
MDAFEHWLESGLNESDPSREFSRIELAEFFTRFNREIVAIQKDWSDPQLAKGIWHLYGCGSCYLNEVSQLEPASVVFDFFESVPLLYSNLFEVRCAAFFSHLDQGPEPANPLNGPCYMLWDMTCGIDSFRFSGRPEYIDQSIRLLDRLAMSHHYAVKESAIHGLGHMIDDFRDRCQPILERILSTQDLPQELQNYTKNAIDHYIQ